MHQLPCACAQERQCLYYADRGSTVTKVYVLGLGILFGVMGCSEQNPRVVTTLNQGAALTGDLPWNPLQWRVITSAVNKQDSTMYTVFGNDLAVQYVAVGSAADHRPSYSYQEYEGAPLKKVSDRQGPTPDGRAAYLLSQRA